jgi:hypothetical protein
VRRELDGQGRPVRTATQQVAILAHAGDLEATDPTAVEVGADLDFASVARRSVTGIQSHCEPPSWWTIRVAARREAQSSNLTNIWRAVKGREPSNG